MIDIEIEKVGCVKGDILWMSDKFVKITYVKRKYFINFKKTELFHISEIINFSKIYDSEYNIRVL